MVATLEDESFTGCGAKELQAKRIALGAEG